jgi:acyl carrier protein
MMSREEILEGVRRCVSTTLDIPADSIREDARLIENLGADSLDLLDLTFQLEEAFAIRISPRDIERRTRAKLGDVPLEVDGVYTPEALAELRAALPEVPPGELAEGLTQAQLPYRFRVATMVNLVSRLMGEQHTGAEAETDG